jgi:hypothetical protein
MTAIFSRTGLLGLLLLMACGEREPVVVKPPEDAAIVIEPFLEKLRKGDKAGAATHVSAAATDELDKQFAADSKALAATTKLTPRFFGKSRNRIYHIAGTVTSPDDHDTTIVYAAKKDGKWTSATVRVYRYRDEPYKVEYWRISNVPPAPPLPSGIDEKKVKIKQQMLFITLAVLSVFGIAGLALLFWIIRRKPHLVVNAAPGEERPLASTVRNK